VKSKVPEKEIVVYDGCCPVHDVLRSASVNKVKAAKPRAVVIAHPECRADVLEIADEICSTTAMIGAWAGTRRPAPSSSPPSTASSTR